MEKKFVLGVDIGTYSSKGVLVDLSSGEIVAEHTLEHGIESPKPGWAEHDADQVWWGEFCAISQNLLNSSQVVPADIKCVGVSGLGVCILPIDAGGQPLRKAILYGIDTRSLDEIDELEAKFSEERVFDISGMKLTVQSAGPKILWIKKNEPEIFKATKYFLTSHNYIIYKLTGKPILDIFTMAEYTPMVDIRRHQWHPETTAYITPVDKLPNPDWSCELAGVVTDQASRQTGLAAGTKVIVGVTDAGAETVSTGANQPGDLMIMFGSSFFFVLLADKLIPSKKYWAAPWLDDSAFTIQGGTSTSGSITRWFRDNFGGQEVANQLAGGKNAYAALADLLNDSPPGARGLISLPYFEGERTPIYDSKARGTVFGLTIGHTRADVYRSLLEGIAFGIRDIIETIAEEGIFPKRIIGTAGGTKNRGWMQIVSDIANIEMTILETESSAAYGDAFMAGVGLGEFKSLSENNKWVKNVSTIKPNFANAILYKDLYKVFKGLYPDTKHHMHFLHDFQR
jgi:xylulokinase